MTILRFRSMVVWPLCFLEVFSQCRSPRASGPFIANGGSGFILGISGATQAAVYHFQNLTFNGQTQERLDDPVELRVANGKNDKNLVSTLSRERHLLTFLGEHPKQAKRGYLVCRCQAPLHLHNKVTALPWFCL